MATFTENTTTPGQDLGYLFQRLPLELQREVWKHCLPSRVIDVENCLPACGMCPRRRSGNPPRKRLDDLNVANRIPAIGQVCRESRRAVYSSQGAIRDAGFIPYFLRDEDSKFWLATWFDPTLDILLFAGKYSEINPYCNTSYWLDPHPRKMRWANLEPFPDNHLMHFRDPEAPICLPKYSVTRLKEQQFQGQRVFFYIRQVSFHLAYHEALSCGLFGLLADEPLATVGLRDVDRIRQAYELLLKEPMGARDTDVCGRPSSEVLEKFLDSTKQDELIRYHSASIEFQWLESQKGLSTDVTRAMSPWVDVLESCTEQRIKVMDRLKEFIEVQEILKSLPEFELVFLFRLCQDHLHTAEHC